ncbi:hypothetical protein MOQ72_36665 [Saccharopolyspora sp. K220]|nr:hypothetical protein [Saccharopolyspora soli]MCI2422965.1 hypothetical protein [Saccharopolyspora soli]
MKILLGGGGWGVLIGAFHEFPVLEAGLGADEGDEFGCVHCTPADLG